ncbi:MAG: low molecular weight phosphatase family protein [Rhodobacteraceae bacterium]|nr:MAG: low molecular weight phosphatase family protein [Paracoccaceae bacterium]
MTKKLSPSSVLFCCDNNSIRSPIAEGLMKKQFGTSIYAQSVGVESDLEIDGFAIAVCKEIDVELSRHQVRSFDDMEKLGEHMIAFDVIIALSKASYHKVLQIASDKNIEIIYWPIKDPVFKSERREEKLTVYRLIRNQLQGLITEAFIRK